MMKLLKWIGVVVVVLVVLVVGAALVLPQFISVDTYMSKIVAEVKSATGRDLKVSGPVHLSVLPHLAIEAAQVSLSNATGAQSKDMMTLGSFQVEVELFPLINKTVVVDRFVLKDPVIALEVDKQGRPNWDFSTAKAPGAAAPAGSASAPAQKQAGGADMSSLGALRLGDVRLENGTISYLDQRTGQRTVIDKINSSVSLPDINSALKVDGSAQYNGVVLKLKLNVDKTGDFMTRQGSGVEASVGSDVMNFDFKGKGAVALPASANGAIDLKVPSLRKLAEWAGAPLPKGEGFGPLAIAGKLEMSGNEIKFNDAQLSLDAIKGKGQIALNTAGAKPDVKGSLELDSFNVNPYLPPQNQGGSGSAAPAAGGGAGKSGAAGWSDEPIDVSALKSANVDFQITASAIQFRKIKIDKSAITLRLKDGHLATDLTQLATYGGGGKATVVLDGSGPEPALTLSASMSGVQVEKLLVDAIDLDRLTGKGSIEVSLAGKGKSERALISSLNGKGNFNVADGEIKGLDLLKMLNGAATNVANLASLGGGGGGNTTPFSHLTGTWTMTNGIMKNPDLVLDSPNLKAEGAGTVDLPTRTVDYKVTPKVAGLGVPVLIKGPWDNLTYLPDLAGILKGGVGGAADIVKGGAGGVTDTLKGFVPGAGGSSSGSGTSGGAAPKSGSGSGSSGGIGNPLKGLFGN